MLRAMFLCLFLLISSSGVLCQMSLTASGPGALKPSQTLSVTCTLTGILVSSSYDWSWIRQFPGKQLEWLGHINGGGGTSYPPSLQSRLSITRDVSKNEYYLQMRSMRAEDTAIYYCVRRIYYNYYFDYWGPGTQVTVTTVATQAPFVFPLIPCGDTGESLKPVAIGCLAKNFLPDAINFSWNDKDNSSFTSGLRKYGSVLGRGGTYTASTQVDVTSASWVKKDPYYCKVTHSALGAALTIKVVQQVVKSKEPTVTLNSPVKEDIVQDNATILCLSRGFYPKPITMKWWKNGVKVTSGFRTEEPVTDKDGNFDVVSWLDITSKDWNSNSLYSCEVEHDASKFLEMRNISKSMVCDASQGGPTTVDVFTVPPNFEDMFESKSAKLTCVVTNMQGYDGLNITWSREDTNEVVKTQITDKVVNDNGTFSAKGIATVCADQWMEGRKFTCKVQHQDLPSQKVVHLQKKNGGPRRAPVVYVYPPPSEELALKQDGTLVCLVKDFYPCDLFVKWMQNGEELPKVDYLDTPNIDEVDSTTGQKTCFKYSKLKIPESDWSTGQSYTCVVGHEALPLQVTQKSIDKSSGKPTAINVSVMMSDAANVCY